MYRDFRVMTQPTKMRGSPLLEFDRQSIHYHAYRIKFVTYGEFFRRWKSIRQSHKRPCNTVEAIVHDEFETLFQWIGTGLKWIFKLSVALSLFPAFYLLRFMYGSSHIAMASEDGSSLRRVLRDLLYQASIHYQCLRVSVSFLSPRGGDHFPSHHRPWIPGHYAWTLFLFHLGIAIPLATLDVVSDVLAWGNSLLIGWAQFRWSPRIQDAVDFWWRWMPGGGGGGSPPPKLHLLGSVVDALHLCVMSAAILALQAVYFVLPYLLVLHALPEMLSSVNGDGDGDGAKLASASSHTLLVMPIMELTWVLIVFSSVQEKTLHRVEAATTVAADPHHHGRCSVLPIWMALRVMRGLCRLVHVGFASILSAWILLATVFSWVHIG